MNIKVITWNDASKNAFKGEREEIDSFIEWKTKKGFELIEEKEMTLEEYNSLKR